jgi:mono/diheme cytochrome c family protein
MSGFSCPLRVVALSAPLLVCLLSGCGPSDEGYPKNLRYPPRSDALVINRPSSEPVSPDPPGKLDEPGAGSALGNLPGAKTLDPRKVPREQQTELKAALEKRFGTPRNPLVGVELEGADQPAKDFVATLDDPMLYDGSILYRRHCLHCHGLAGDGRGPTGPWVNPHPRDYRQGIFKFISTGLDVTGRKPRRADLYRTIQRGIDGTSMPSFGLLSDEEINKLVSYVIHLSLRGEVEYNALKALLESTVEDVDARVEELAQIFLGYWAASNTGKANEAPPYPYKDEDKGELHKSIVRGYRIFTNPQGDASCIKCHADFGRQVPFRYDDWGTLVRPANLTASVYRGGRRPVDLYWRISGGIPPSGMPGTKLTGPEYWDLVNFVRALPYPQMLPEEVRNKIYIEDRNKPESHASAR